NLHQVIEDFADSKKRQRSRVELPESRRTTQEDSIQISSHQVIEDFAVPVGIDAFPGRLHVAWHMTRSRKTEYSVAVECVNTNILGAVFSGNRLLRRNQNLRFSHIINPLESFERPVFFHDRVNYVIMQQFWCYPGTATCYCWNEMSNSSYSSVFHDFSGVLEYPHTSKEDSKKRQYTNCSLIKIWFASSNGMQFSADGTLY
ncbi:hypothetical protein T03_5270, partial [Trichinella britovi]